MTRPYWQKTPCPKWCVETHHDKDHPDDRRHFGPTMGVTFVESTPIVGFRQGEYISQALTGWLSQHVKDAEPTIDIGSNNDLFSSPMTLEEAETLANKLLELVAEAREAMAAPQKPARAVWPVPMVGGAS